MKVDQGNTMQCFPVQVIRHFFDESLYMGYKTIYQNVTSTVHLENIRDKIYMAIFKVPLNKRQRQNTHFIS